MSNVKKIIALMLVVVFALALVACGGSDTENNNPTTTKAASGDVDITETTSAGETTTTVSGKVTKTGKDSKTTTTKAQQAAANDPDLIEFIPRTTNKAGNASDSFVKSLKGYNLKILYPWENIYGTNKCKANAEAAIAAVEKEYGVTISEKGQFNKYNENLAADLAAKKCDNQIYYAQDTYFASWFQKGYLASLNTAMRESGVDFNDKWYISEAKGFLNVNGNQYGWIPYEDEYTTPACVIYNKKLIQSKNLQDPAKVAAQGKWTWSTLEAYANKFANDKSTTGFGTMSTVLLLEDICNEYGTTLTKVSKGSQPTTNITDNKVKTALTELYEWTVGKKAWCDTFKNQSWTYAKTQLAAGKIAMLYATHDTIKELATSSDNSNFGIAPLPNKSGSKTYTNIATPQFIAFIPIMYQKDAAKILFIRNEYYRYNYQYNQRNFQYKWSSYLGDSEAIANAKAIKFGEDGNKIVFSWTSLCEDSSAKTTTAGLISDVINGKSTPAQAISSKKNGLSKTYKDTWEGWKTTGNV